MERQRQNVLRSERGHFLKGSAPGPGRPKGFRARLQEMAVEALAKDFAQNGEEVIRRVRERKPEVYLTNVISLLPKQKERIESPFIDLSDSELEQLEELLTSLRAKTVQAIEAHKANDIPAPTVIEPAEKS